MRSPNNSFMAFPPLLCTFYSTTNASVVNKNVMFLKYYNLPVTIVATKSDKVGGSKKQKNLKMILDTLDLVVGDDLVVFSSVTKLGVKDVLKKIEDLVIEQNEII